MEGTKEERDLVGSLEKGLAVLEILAQHPAGMTLTEMAEKAGLTRAGARRFLLTLVSTGYAIHDARTFRLSPRLIALARTWLSRISLWTFAEPFMREVAMRLNEACSAAVLSGEDVVYVARIPGERIISVALSVGTRLPAYCTAMGRVLLSALPEPELQHRLASAAISKRTEKTVTQPHALTALIRAVAIQGYALVDEELEIGLRSIAVPLRDPRGAIVAAINVSTHSSRLSTDAMVEEVLPMLFTAASRIESFFALD